MNVDWNLLADHLGGALDGTEEGVEVARLVSTDPGWAQAAAELSDAFASVAVDLRALPAPSLPDDVARRLESVLAGAVAVAPDVVSRPGPATPSPAGRAGDEPRHPPRRPGRRRRRMVGWGAGFTVAAGLAVFAALGITALDLDRPLSEIVAGGGDDADTAGQADGAAPGEAPNTLEAEPEPRGGEGAPGPVVIATGIEYEAPMLVTDEPGPPASAAPELGSASHPPAVPVAPEFGTNDGEVPEQVPPELLELWTDPQARADCLAMVRDSVGPGPVRIDTVDFARYEGEDALVIWLTTSDGLRQALIAGVECGTVTAGPDLQYQTPVS